MKADKKRYVAIFSKKNGDVDNILPKNQAILRDLFDACPDTGEVKSVGNKILG